MILCFTGVGATQPLGNSTFSAIWVQRARTLGATTIIQCPNVDQARQSIRQLTQTFNQVYFIGHASHSAFYFFATMLAGEVSGSSRSSLNLTQLNVPNDPSFQRTHDFFQDLARLLPATGGRVTFESCNIGTHLNLANAQNTLASFGKRCTLRGYCRRVNWLLTGTTVSLNEGANQAITIPG
jgi:hypothetical protein